MRLNANFTYMCAMHILKTASMAEEALASYAEDPSTLLDVAVQRFALSHGGVQQRLAAADALHGPLAPTSVKPSVLASDILQEEAQ